MSWFRRTPVIAPEVERIIQETLRIAELQTQTALTMAKALETLSSLYTAGSTPESRNLEDFYQVTDLTFEEPSDE